MILSILGWVVVAIVALYLIARYFIYVFMLSMVCCLGLFAYFPHSQEMLVPVLACFIVALPYVLITEKLKEKLQ